MFLFNTNENCGLTKLTVLLEVYANVTLERKITNNKVLFQTCDGPFGIAYVMNVGAFCPERVGHINLSLVA